MNWQNNCENPREEPPEKNINFQPAHGSITGEEEISQRSRIILLGTGTPNAEPDRSGPSLVIEVDSIPYLIDFGPGVIRRAVSAGLDITKIHTVFLTHLHSDHTAGYPDLILTPWVLGREEPLTVFGPPGFDTMTAHMFQAYEMDIQQRILGPEPANRTGWEVNAREIQPGRIFQEHMVVVEALPVNHGSWDAYAFKFITPDRTIVISGDTAPCDDLIEFSRGCDVLIHEVYSKKELSGKSQEWQEYHRSMHTSSHELGELATEIKPGLLILYHQLLWGTKEEDLLEEIREYYDGPVVFGRDLDVF